TLGPIAKTLGYDIALLTGSLPAKVKDRLFRELRSGLCRVAIGTHALFQETVQFSRLGLCIVDEQHRFGVAERMRLLAKATPSPHLLMMTATPIPRTLAHVVYGDLENTVLDEMPPGRTSTQTAVLRGKKGRDKAYSALAAEIRRGGRAFVVCPLV